MRIRHCSECGAEGTASCDCGAPYLPAGMRASLALLLRKWETTAGGTTPRRRLAVPEIAATARIKLSVPIRTRVSVVAGENPPHS